MKHTSILIIAALALVSCAKQAGDSRTITVQAGIGTMTKVDYNGYKANFVDGDKISVYAWTGDATAVPQTRVVDGVTNTFDGSKWTPASQMLWDDKSSLHYFLGISPARTVTDFTADAYTLDPANFAASDLMIATNVAGLAPSDTPVELNFTHAMARLDVNLTFRNQWATAPTVSAVTVKAKKTATVDYLSKAVTASGSAEAIALTAANNAAWSGLQVPQTGVNTITITIEGKDYVFTHTSDIPLESGKYTVLNLTVGRDQIVLSGEIKITDWASQGAAIEGDAEEADPKINGHAYVDMGLPSGLKWATCNVGATKPEEYGDYFAWGEREPKSNYNWGTYFDSDTGTSFTKYTTYKKTVLDAEDDAASANWGGSWRMPTNSEWTELLNNCTSVWTALNGVNGRLFTSKINGATLFIPAAGNKKDTNFTSFGNNGFYWSSSLSDNASAFNMTFTKSFVNCNLDTRSYGESVRPISE